MWTVRALLVVAADDVSKSFVADLAGKIRWQTGEAWLTGAVTDGWRRNTHVEQALSLRRPWLDGTGTIRFVEQTAQR